MMLKPVSLDKLRAYRCWKNRLFAERKANTIQEVVGQFVALNTDDIKSGYIALYNRMNMFNKKILEGELYKRGSIGRLRCMRKGLFFVLAEDFRMIFSATSSQRNTRLKQAEKRWGISEDEFNDVARPLLRDIEVNEKKRSQIIKKVPKELKRTISLKEGANEVSSSIVDLTIDRLMERWQIIPGGETWDKTGRKFALFSNQYKPQQFDIPEEQAEKMLVNHYIKSYGPVLLEDIAWWCEMTSNKVNTFITEMDDQITPFSLPECGGTFYLSTEEAAKFDDFEEQAYDICTLLGANDPLFLGYRRSDAIVAHKYEKNLFTEFGQSAPAVIAAGEAVGTWMFSERINKVNISIDMFRHIGTKLEDKLCVEIDKMGDFLSGTESLTEVSIDYH